ncbi:hypothetical protein J2T22_000621 [Pseudarthrobacter defluvii]|uniref:Uncharacterized protein n=1 Tax=Pseudarthrobacter defluvii TaxID=410837 RepID=A0ABT9UCS3_9MICC|nr:hypothetical protein [Pseudarthrobacter defluvii]MDQ0117451.1 hypothetical protein [Pseudarthrobacter defluvii]
MPQPGLPGSQFAGPDQLFREIRDLKRQVQQLAAANPLGAAGVRAAAGGIIVEGFQTVNGPATFTGSLDLPAGSVSNDALASPIETATASAGISNYAIDTTATVRASVTLTVPVGFSRAIVISNATAMGTNSGTAPDYLYCSVTVQTVNGGELYTSAPVGLGASLSSPFQPTLTGLTGGDTITVGVATRAGASTWAADPANQAAISATAIFLK